MSYLVGNPEDRFSHVEAHFLQCLQHRALNPDDPLPELSPLIANYLKPPQEVLTTCEESFEKMKKKFKLEVVKKKEEKTGENLFKEKLVYVFNISLQYSCKDTCNYFHMKICGIFLAFAQNIDDG